ncbi:MAG: DUF2878 domain-containing protein [Gammaproteobacteria bacterium]|nr:DUF2878 domain-containing protein [Gammaproteobacteria bacterium]
MNWQVLINAALFQVTWFAAVLWGTSVGLAAVAVMIAHAGWAGSLKADVALGAILGAVGLVLDTLWIQVGILDYQGLAVAPPWIIILWVGVGASLNHSLAFLARSPALGALLVGPAGVVSYLAGEKLGGVIVGAPLGLGLVAVVWVALFYVLLTKVVPWVNARCAVKVGVGATRQ